MNKYMMDDFVYLHHPNHKYCYIVGRVLSFIPDTDLYVIELRSDQTFKVNDYFIVRREQELYSSIVDELDEARKEFQKTRISNEN